MYITKHAEERIVERVGINKKAVSRNARNAIERGYTLDQTKGALASWIAMHSEKDYVPKLYGNCLYIFSSQYELITVLIIPASIFTHADTYIDGKNSHRKFQKSYTIEEEYFDEDWDEEYEEDDFMLS